MRRGGERGEEGQERERVERIDKWQHGRRKTDRKVGLLGGEGEGKGE